MGNQIEVYNNKDELIGNASHSLACWAYVDFVGKKYNPNFNMYSDPSKINQILEDTFKNANPEDNIISYIFMNDEYTLIEENIPVLKKAIEIFPENFNQGPRKHLEAYLKILEKHKEITLKYTGISTAAFMVTSGDKS